MFIDVLGKSRTFDEIKNYVQVDRRVEITFGVVVNHPRRRRIRKGFKRDHFSTHSCSAFGIFLVFKFLQDKERIHDAIAPLNHSQRPLSPRSSPLCICSRRLTPLRLPRSQPRHPKSPSGLLLPRADLRGKDSGQNRVKLSRRACSGTQRFSAQAPSASVSYFSFEDRATVRSLDGPVAGRAGIQRHSI